MSILDLSLVKTKWPHGQGASAPATINGWQFNIDPSSVALPIRAKVQKYRTLGGFVVQLYGTTWGDLTVSGQFGTGGWQAQLGFLDRMVQIASSQSMQRQAQFAGQNFQPSQPFRFTFPLLGWDFLCYLKDYTSPDGPQAVHMENVNINPKWTLTLFVVTDNGSLTTVAKGAYLQRLAPGLGVMWNSTTESYQGYITDQYNAPLTGTDLQNYVNNPTGKGSGEVVSAVPSSTQGPTGVADPNGSVSAAGSTGKSINLSSYNNIKSQNDFSNALLQYLQIVPGSWAVGSSQADNDCLILNAQQANEGQWNPNVVDQTGPFGAMQMHNPLNINQPGGWSNGYVYGINGVGGTGSFPTWGDGVAGTAAFYLQSGYAQAVQGLKDSDVHEWMAGITAGGWAGHGNPGYADTVYGLYQSYGGTQ